jgi:hypothetical protein
MATKTAIKIDLEQILLAKKAEQTRRDRAEVHETPSPVLEQSEASSDLSSDAAAAADHGIKEKLHKINPFHKKHKESLPEEEEPAQETTENSSTEHIEGIHVEQKGIKKPLLPMSLEANKMIADQAAERYVKREKKIQKACAKIDAGEKPLPPQQHQTCCVIL